jgi:cadmium resistance protein CadD (predicted permease)
MIMNGAIAAIFTGLAAFVVTNIDDILILTLFFAQVDTTFCRRHIVIGQYLGFSLLLLASLPGFFGSYFVPPASIRLLGLVPVVIGLSGLLKFNEEENFSAKIQPETSLFSSWLSPQTYSVAAVTVANGSDNIGVYVPLFANSELESLLAILGVFLVLVGVWCYAAYQLTNLSAIAQFLTGYGSAFVPCALIGLGVFIVQESFVLAGIAIAGSCLWLLVNNID